MNAGTGKMHARGTQGAGGASPLAETTELVFVLDRSGSMAGLEADAIGGYNSLLARQRDVPGRALVTTVLFDDRVEVLCRRADLAEVRPLTSREYWARGCTALLDAVGSTMRHVRRWQKDDGILAPEHTVFVITTDGLENASREYGLGEVRHWIRKREREDGWEFVFLGANIDAVETAGDMGIPEERAATYVSDACGTAVMFDAVDAAVSAVREGSSLGAAWKRGVEADAEKRG